MAELISERANAHKLRESVEFYSKQLGLCLNYVLGTLASFGWCADKLPQDVPFCKGNCGREHNKVQTLKDKILRHTAVCCFKDIHGRDCPKCADNTCPCAPTREDADARAIIVGICLPGESNYDNTQAAREAYIAKEKAKLAKASKAEAPKEVAPSLADFLPPQEWTPAKQDALLRAAEYLFHTQFVAQVGPIWDECVGLDDEDSAAEEKLLEQFWAAEEQRDAEEAALAAAEQKVAIAPDVPRNWAALGGGAKPREVPKAPAKKRTLPPIGTVEDLQLDELRGFHTKWADLAEDK
jgi:hypothetical protein